MTMNIDIPLKQAVPAYNLAAVLCSGFEGGFNYWGRATALTHLPIPEGEDVVLKSYFQPLLEGGSITIEDVESGQKKTHVLDLPAVLRGVQVIADKYPHHLADVLQGEGDATTGDVLIQCAVFGELIYG